jgi:hypothetical protein
MPGELAGVAGHGPAAGFDHPLPAGRAGRGGAPFVDQMHNDPGEQCFVAEYGDGPADLPLP